MILSLILFSFSPASAKDVHLTPTPATTTLAEITEQAMVVAKANGGYIPEQMVPGENYSAHGWVLKTSSACAVKGAVTYLVASNGTTSVSVAHMFPIEGVQKVVTTHDHGANGTIDSKSDTAIAARIPDTQLYDTHYGVLNCIVNPPPAPKK